jgi:hypothetical protein
MAPKSLVFLVRMSPLITALRPLTVIWASIVNSYKALGNAVEACTFYSIGHICACAHMNFTLEDFSDRQAPNATAKPFAEKPIGMRTC